MNDSSTPASGDADTHPVRRGQLWINFALSVSGVVVLLILGVFIGVSLRDERLLRQEILGRAQAHFRDVVLTRRWNALHGGVYVEKKDGVVSNPYLENPDITTTDGRVFTMKNPALMTREMSELAAKEGLFRYRITSLKPINPGNTPDPFERQALALFEAGTKETHSLETGPEGRTMFRYMAPLYVEASCLPCHAKQGYAVGQVRGGISVSFDVSQVEDALAANQRTTMALLTLATCLVLGLLYLFIYRLMTRLRAAQARIELLAVTDELTGLKNRRAFFETLRQETERAKRYGSKISLAILDVDRFKRINDDYGHAAGDLALSHVARLMAANSRASDLVARYGGEEFIILFPETDCADACKAADKLRALIAATPCKLADGGLINLTVSGGVACFDATPPNSPPSPDLVLQAADAALYKAKSSGRNRVMEA